MGRGQTVGFVVAVENDARAPGSFLVRAQGSSPQFAIKYFDGDQNVTAQVTGDGYLTAQLAPGERAQLRVQIRAWSTAPSNTHVTATIKVSVHRVDDRPRRGEGHRPALSGRVGRRRGAAET